MEGRKLLPNTMSSGNGLGYSESSPSVSARLLIGKLPIGKLPDSDLTVPCQAEHWHPMVAKVLDLTCYCKLAGIILKILAYRQFVGERSAPSPLTSNAFAQTSIYQYMKHRRLGKEQFFRKVVLQQLRSIILVTAPFATIAVS